MRASGIMLTFLLLSSISNLMAQDPPVYQEVDGLLIIEMESNEAHPDWTVDTTVAGHTGGSYMTYRGPNHFNPPRSYPHTMKIYVETTGTYRFQWHSRITQGNDRTEHNDSWLRFADASGFYAKKNTSILYPGGSGMMPNPNGASVKGWFKVYQNVLSNWTWNTSTSDHNPHAIFVEFDSIGEYTIEISGRSTGHAINRLVLYHSSVNSSTALDLSKPESPVMTALSLENSKAWELMISPNPATDFISIDISDTFQPGLYGFQILDPRGRVLHKFSDSLSNSGFLRFPIGHLPKGVYFLQSTSVKSPYLGKFIKL